MDFEWDEAKNAANLGKHGFDFLEGTECFFDPSGIELIDAKHSHTERRYFWVGKSKKGCILTVWYTKRGSTIRIIGVAEWRKMRKIYETAKL